MAVGFQRPGMFGLQKPALAPVQNVAPPEAFVWGAGGSKYTPEQVAQMRAMAQAEMQDATSGAPVAHWLQGLNRSLGAVTGGLRMRKADKADAAIAAEEDAVTAALLADRSEENVLRTLANSRAPKGARDVAGLLAEQLFAKPAAQPEIVQLANIANDPNQPAHVREAAGAAVRSKTDPTITATLPGDRFFSGPQSALVAAMGGGGQASGVPQTMAPPAEAIAELKISPDAAAIAEFDEAFGPGAAARILGNGGAGASRVGSNFLDGL